MFEPLYFGVQASDLLLELINLVVEVVEGLGAEPGVEFFFYLFQFSFSNNCPSQTRFMAL